MAYGDGQMYVLLKGDNITPYDYARPAYNTTLSYFPLKAPFTLASPPASTISTPWFLDCEDTSTNTTVAAAANGKFYFVCPVREQRNLSRYYQGFLGECYSYISCFPVCTFFLVLPLQASLFPS